MNELISLREQPRTEIALLNASEQEEEEQVLVCEVSPPQIRRNERKGLAWVAGSFLICPCHLPFTLGLATTVLGGTAAGTALQQYPWIAGGIIAAAWAGGTWRGFRYFRNARNCTTCAAK